MHGLKVFRSDIKNLGVKLEDSDPRLVDTEKEAFCETSKQTWKIDVKRG